MKFGKTVLSATVAVLAAAAGCSTSSVVIPKGATTETVAGFSKADLERVASELVQGMATKSNRFHTPGARRVVNVAPFAIDTLARGNDAARLAGELQMAVIEALTDSDIFIVYNPEAAASAAMAGGAAHLPEYKLEATLQQRNEPLDGGDVYQQFTLLVKLTATEYHSDPQQRGMIVWPKSIHLTKLVDRKRAVR